VSTNTLAAKGAVALLVLLAAGCSSSPTSTPSQPAGSTATAQATSGGAYRTILKAQWQAIADAYLAAPCAKLDSGGMPADRTGCVASTNTLITGAKKLRADLQAQTPPAGLERTDADLKIALDDLVARLTESNQAVDKADGPAFAEAGGLIATAFRNAQRAELALLK
jgi:hypothetical protein